jgi:predicted HTH domain antitoxin
MEMVQIEIPQHLVRATRLTPPELRRELAIALFQQGRLSFGKARELADTDFWTFQHLLGSRGISPHYDLEEYEADLKTIEEQERRSPEERRSLRL